MNGLSAAEIAQARAARRGRGTLSVPARVIFEVLTLAALLAPIVWLAIHWSQIPAVVPRRYDVHGHVSAVGGKGLLIALPILAAVMYVLLGVLSFFPQAYNLPAPVGDPRRPAMEHLGIELILTLRLECLTLFAMTALADAYTALTGASGLSALYFPSAIAVLLLTGALFLVAMYRVRA